MRSIPRRGSPLKKQNRENAERRKEDGMVKTVASMMLVFSLVLVGLAC